MTAKATITTKYIAALSIVAATLIGSQLMMIRQTSSKVSHGRIINISGMQRMLSQRIALMSNELSTSEEAAIGDKMAGKLQKAFDMMSSNQAELTASNQRGISDPLHKLYYGPEGVDHRVTSYLGLANKLLTMYRNTPEAKKQQCNVSRQIAEIARNGFVDQLDAVVTQHQLELEQELGVLQTMETTILTVGLLVLLLEALLIFRPMANQIASTIDELSDVNSDLKSANDELVEFSYRISHDLRAPIASSIGLTQVISESLAEKEFDEATEAAKRVGNSMIRLDELITDVIHVSKNKNLEATDESIQVLPMINDILKRYSRLPGFERLQVEIDIDPVLTVTVKKLFLKQSIDNLVSNAIKYSDPGKQPPKIKISASMSDDRFMISVADNGIGIPLSCRDNLFGMFKRFHPRRSFGSGLGLYLVKKNVERLDGSISFEALPEGSMFKIQFPVAAEVLAG